MIYDDRRKELADLEIQAYKTAEMQRKLVDKLVKLTEQGRISEADFGIVLNTAVVLSNVTVSASLQRALDELESQGKKETP